MLGIIALDCSHLQIYAKVVYRQYRQSANINLKIPDSEYAKLKRMDGEIRTHAPKD